MTVDLSTGDLPPEQVTPPLPRGSGLYEPWVLPAQEGRVVREVGGLRVLLRPAEVRHQVEGRLLLRLILLLLLLGRLGLEEAEDASEGHAGGHELVAGDGTAGT